MNTIDLNLKGVKMKKQLGLFTSLIFLCTTAMLWVGCSSNQCCDTSPVCEPCQPVCEQPACPPKPCCQPPAPCKPVCTPPCAPPCQPQCPAPVCPQPCE